MEWDTLCPSITSILMYFDTLLPFLPLHPLPLSALSYPGSWKLSAAGSCCIVCNFPWQVVRLLNTPWMHHEFVHPVSSRATTGVPFTSTGLVQVGKLSYFTFTMQQFTPSILTLQYLLICPNFTHLKHLTCLCGGGLLSLLCLYSAVFFLYGVVCRCNE